MKNIIRLFILLLALYSCNSSAQKKNILGIEIITKSVYYIPIDTVSLMHNKVDYTSSERSKACAELIYKIVNMSDKKIFLALDTNQLSYYGSTSDFLDAKHSAGFSTNTLCLIDCSSNKKSPRFVQHDNLTALDDSLSIYYSKKLELDLKRRNYMYRNSHEKIFAENSILLHPGEYKIVRTIVCLPLLTDKESDPDFFSTAVLLSPSSNYKFSLAISIDKDSVRKELPAYLMKEINDNGYEIFGGQLISNSIPIVVRP